MELHHIRKFSLSTLFKMNDIFTLFVNLAQHSIIYNCKKNIELILLFIIKLNIFINIK